MQSYQVSESLSRPNLYFAGDWCLQEAERMLAAGPPAQERAGKERVCRRVGTLKRVPGMHIIGS